MIRAALVVALAACRYHIDDVADAGDATCAHTFCDDFERSAPVQGAWDETHLAGGALSLDSGQLVASSTTVMPATSQVYLGKELGLATTHIHVEADMEFDAGTDGEIDLVQIRWDMLPGTCTSFGFYLVRDRQTSSVAMQQTYANCGGVGNQTSKLMGFPSVAPSGMHHVAIDIALAPISSAQVATAIDTTAAVTEPTFYDVPPSTISMHLGVPSVQANTALWTVRYDNVIVDLQ